MRTTDPDTVRPARPPVAAAPSAEEGAGAWLRWARELTDPALRSGVAGLQAPVRRVAGYHLGWWDEHGTPRNAGWGKAVRPALVLVSAWAAGAEPGTGVPAAAAVQLAHDSSLLHDDIIDGDALRRHRPTAWRVFGVHGALLAGDAMLPLAGSLASAGPHGARALELLHAAVQEFVASQFADVGFERRDDVSRTECTAMAAGKTGALMGAACGMGCLAGGGTPEQVARLTEFGTRLGLAFQHTDDLLGIWGDPDVTGKPVGSDIRARKKSLPVVAALTSATPEAGELAALYAREAALDDDGTARAVELVERAGGRRWTASRARTHLTEALGHLRDASLDAAGSRVLERIAHLLVDRDH